MIEGHVKRLVLLSGPSCVGKGPLIRSVERFFSNNDGNSPVLTNRPITFGKVEVIKSFASRKIKETLLLKEKLAKLRKDDKPECFADSDTIESWRSNPDLYIVGSCRHRPQAISLQHLKEAFARFDTVYLEAYYTLGRQVLEHPVLSRIHQLSVTTIFLSPLSVLEIRELQKDGVDMQRYLTYMMMRKMLDREQAMGKKLSDNILSEDLERCEDAYGEMSFAHQFSIFMVNHDGEGHPHWHLKQDTKPNFFVRQPEGEAAICTRSLARILEVDVAKVPPPNTVRLTEPLFG